MTDFAAARQKLYIIGSLRNDRIPTLARRLREELCEIEVFDDWYSAGPRADDHWKEYEQARGLGYLEALEGYSANHVFDYDRGHLDTSSHCLLVLPAGKSGHMEIMYAAYGVGARTAILLDPEDVRWDVMYKFIPTILQKDEDVRTWIESTTKPTTVAGKPYGYWEGEPIYDSSRWQDITFFGGTQWGDDTRRSLQNQIRSSKV